MRKNRINYKKKLERLVLVLIDSFGLTRREPVTVPVIKKTKESVAEELKTKMLNYKKRTVSDSEASDSEESESSESPEKMSKNYDLLSSEIDSMAKQTDEFIDSLLPDDVLSGKMELSESVQTSTDNGHDKTATKRTNPYQKRNRYFIFIKNII